MPAPPASYAILGLLLAMCSQLLLSRQTYMLVKEVGPSRMVAETIDFFTLNVYGQDYRLRDRWPMGGEGERLRRAWADGPSPPPPPIVPPPPPPRYNGRDAHAHYPEQKEAAAPTPQRALQPHEYLSPSDVDNAHQLGTFFETFTEPSPPPLPDPFADDPFRGFEPPPPRAPLRAPHIVPPPSLSPPSMPAPQADELRRTYEKSASSIEMRCGERIPPEAILKSVDGNSQMTIHVASTYKELREDDGLHAWSYKVEFRNEGKTTVQLMTRHWVIVDANGKIEEIKGPGARGQLPIIRPSGSWSYESGTRIATESGSMHGYFTFEEVDANSNGLQSASSGKGFVARAGRLALSSDGLSTEVPCAGPIDPANGGRLPATSVHSTNRVLVGAVAELASRDDDLRVYAFLIDLQVNNAREESVTILGIKWEIIDANGQRHHSAGTVGGKDAGKIGTIRLHPGSALRLRTTLPQLHTPKAKISGALIARFGDTKEELGDLSTPVFEPLEDTDLIPEDEPVEIVIAPLGASVDGAPVEDYQPLTFLDTLGQFPMI